MRRRQLVVMVKEPRPGQVKTRLGADIGRIDAAWWFRHQCRTLIRRLEDPRWRLVLAVSPDAEGLASRVWPGHLPRRPQGPGDLGDRMGRLLRDAPPGPVVIVGADIPNLRRQHVARAFAALGTHDAVLGPTPDGGYWAIGLRRTAPPPPAIFASVRWSTRFARDDTLAGLAGCRVALVDMLDDVDDASDLRRVAGTVPRHF